MATFTYKYLFTSDPDVTTNQSRGISLQYNGFALLSCDNLQSYIQDDKAFNLNEVIMNGGTLIFRDISYIANNGVATARDTNYMAAVQNPGAHMFQGMTVAASNEFKFKADEDIQRSTTTIDIPIYDTMLGDRLKGDLRIDGIVLYGQAYNVDFHTTSPEGSLERAVPIGVIVFTSASKPEISPGSEGKGRTDLVFAINVDTAEDRTYDFDGSDEFATWSGMAKHFHVVNNNLNTIDKFVIKDRRMIPSSEYDYAGDNFPSDGTVDVQSRLLFTNSVDGDDWDRNVDFGSPAKLSILSLSSAVNENRDPQYVIGKVDYYKDSYGYTHGEVEGVVESYYSSRGIRDGETEGKVTSGAVYDIDWFSRNKTAISLFSEDVDYHFNDSNFCKYLYHSAPQNVHDRYDNDNWRQNSACFANGNNLFSSCSQAVGEGTNFCTYHSYTRGNAFVLGSTHVKVYARSVKDSEAESNGSLFKYNAFVANSKNVTILGRVKGSRSDLNGQKKRDASNDLNTVINSINVSIDNTSAGYRDINTEEFGRNMVLGSNRVNMSNVSDNVVMGVKGWTYESNVGSKQPIFSEIRNTKQSMFIGGCVKSNCGLRNIVLGLGSDVSADARDGHGLANIIDGAPLAEIGSTNQNNENVLYAVRNCFILGLNNQISAFRERQPWDPVDGSPDLLKNEEQYVFMVGKGLRNDMRQTMHLNNGSGAMVSTLILGTNNNEYYQANQIKQIVVGGYLPTGGSIPKFKYNSLEHTITKSIIAPRDTFESTMINRESIVTLTDVKGRTVDYGSEAINLGFIKGGRSTGTYARYNFTACGRINLFKLYKLLDRLQWEWNESLGKNIVVYRGQDEIGDASTIPDSQWPTPWSDWALDNNGGWSSTSFSHLVDDQYCTWSCYPMATSRDQ